MFVVSNSIMTIIIKYECLFVTYFMDFLANFSREDPDNMASVRDHMATQGW